MSHATERAACHIARVTDDMDIVGGKSPLSVAAAAIYMATQVGNHFSAPCFSVRLKIFVLELPPL